MFFKLFPSLVMVEQKPAVMILLITFQKMNVDHFIATSGGELLKYVKRDKVKILSLPVHSKNPFLIIFNALVLAIYIILYKINIIHARSRAPAWSCYFACLLTNQSFCNHFSWDI